MKLTSYPSINTLINNVSNKIQEVLGNELIGLYLHGSATAGDFNPELSDIDLMALVQSNLSNELFAALEGMHNNLAKSYPEWKDRIEVWYVTVEGIKNFKHHSHEVAVISPGEPFHLKESGDEKLINWYVLGNSSIPLFGPEAKEIIPTISTEEYRAAIKKQVMLWQDWIKEYSQYSSRGAAAYVVFTLSRALYSYSNGEQTSKIKSIQWLSTQFPEWRELTNKAIAWRKVQWQEKQEEVGPDLQAILDFTDFAIQQISKY